MCVYVCVSVSSGPKLEQIFSEECLLLWLRCSRAGRSCWLCFHFTPVSVVLFLRPSVSFLRRGLALTCHFCAQQAVNISVSSLCALVLLVFPDGWFDPVFLPQSKNTSIILTKLPSGVHVKGVCAGCVCCIPYLCSDDDVH